MRYTITVINSTIAFVVASIVEMTLHECGHFFAALAFDGHPVLYHNYVLYPSLTIDGRRIITAIAGPVVSLIIGVITHSMLTKRRLTGVNKLVTIYLSFFGYAGFFGYLMIAPFFSYGDTGYALHALDCPMWAIVIIAFLAAVIMFFISKALSAHFVSMMGRKTAETFKTRIQFICRLVLYPLIAGIAVTTLLNLPVPTPISLIAPLASPFVLLWPFHYYLKTASNQYDDLESVNKKLSAKWLATLLLLIVINRLLVGGFHF